MTLRSAIFCCLASLACSLQAADVLHVAPHGRADGDGSSEHPVATLQQALELSRSSGAKRILLAEGNYYDTQVTLEARDSGLTIESEAGKPATLFGGVPITGWKRDGNTFVAELPKGIDQTIHTLVVNGQPASRARYPQSGYLTHESSFAVPWMSTTAGGWQRKPTDEELLTLKFKPKDIPTTLSAKNAEVTIYHMWDESCVAIASIDRANNIIHLAAKPEHPAGAFDVHRYVIWNTAEGLTQPGQFYHDREKNRMVYRPRGGDILAKLEAVIGTKQSIITLHGADKQPISKVTLRDLHFQATNVPITPGGFGALRYPGAVELTSAADITLTKLTVKNVAGQGIDSGWQPSKTVTIEGCEVTSCGAGGIAVGGDHITIRNNLVANVGVLFPSGIGIVRGGTDCVVENNEVHDTTYSGINYGGTRNLIRRNLLYRCMTQLHDGGAIYLFGAKQCVIEDNLCRDIGGMVEYPRAGYYLDEQSEGSIVRRNVAINVDMPLHNHMSRNCTLEDNVMVNDKDMKLSMVRCESFALRGNVAYAGGKLQVVGANAASVWEQNILFSKTKKIDFLDFPTTSSLLQVPGDTQIADPLFVDVKAKNLHYKPASPAKTLGLPELPTAKIGRTG